MNQLYNTRDYFKSAILSGYSSYSDDCICFLSESFTSLNGYSPRTAFDELLLSVSTINGKFLRLMFDCEMGCGDNFCNYIKSNISRKTGIPQSNILVGSGRISASQFRVLAPGDRIAHENLNGYGTLGGFSLEKNEKGPPYIISNNHVIGNSNAGQAGDGIFSKGNVPRHIARLEKLVPIRFGKYANRLDLAVGSLDSDEGYCAAGYRNARNPFLKERVTKVGASTGERKGVVLSVDETVRVRYGNKTAVFEDQILITNIKEEQSSPFSISGDSGSFIFGENGDFIGLLFAGDNDRVTHANKGLDVKGKLKEWNIVK